MRRVLHIDLGVNTGWCCWPKYGWWKCKKPKEHNSVGMWTFRKNLLRLIQYFDIEVIHYEKPVGGSYNGTRRIANYEGIILAECGKRGIEAVEFSPMEIKKAAGHGHYKKEDMMRELEAQHDLKIENEHVCDAIWAHILYNEKFNQQ